MIYLICKLHKKSHIYQGVGVDCKKYLIFYNADAAIFNNLIPDALWFKLFAIEKKLGRLRPYEKSQCTLDLEILWSKT